ncbi:MAG TPA: DUF3247 family protein [Rhodanobacter sp.]|nr:DUF3247 family protein [Rhodanobacter sp.]
MTRQAAHVYTEPRDIQRFETLVQALSDGARVRLHLVDGRHCEGVVCARPTVQMFYDGTGKEGVNGVVELEHLNLSDWRRRVWFDQITDVEPLDTNAPLRA